MPWIIFAILGAFFWALVHHLDKLLLTKFSAQHGVGTVFIFSSLFPILALPIIAFLEPNVFLLSPHATMVLIVAGVLGGVASLLYFNALEKEETTIVISMFQLLPLFGYILGMIFLDEYLSFIQVLGALIIIGGATLLSLEFIEEKHVHIRTTMVVLVSASAFLYASADVLYKSAGIQTSYLTAVFWFFVGSIVCGFGALIAVKSFRENFFATIKERRSSLIPLNILNELFQTASVLCLTYALLLAPVALVLSVDAYQPIFVFFLGVFLTFFFPKLATEKLSTRELLQKVIAIGMTVVGVLLIAH